MGRSIDVKNGSPYKLTEYFILSETLVHLNLFCVMTHIQKIRELEILDKACCSKKDAPASERKESSAEQMTRQNVDRDNSRDADLNAWEFLRKSGASNITW